MSDNRPEQPPIPKDRPEPSWLDELRDRISGLVDALLHPPMQPVPVPVRRRR